MGANERTLIYVPIAHSREDMGSLGAKLPATRGYHRLADAYWEEVRRQIELLELDWRRVKVYQDGLPHTTPEMVAKVLNKAQSANYDLLGWLGRQGATLVGTESPALLKEEYDLLQAIYNARDEESKRRAVSVYSRRAPSLLEERDTYIADRIHATLPKGGVGLVFIGLAHQLLDKLSEDIAVNTLFADVDE